MTTKDETLVNIVQDIQSRLKTGQAANEASVTQDAELALQLNRFPFAMRITKEDGLLVARKVDVQAPCAN